MRSRIERGRILAGWALITVGIAGCHEPKEIVPVAPPGLEIQRIPAVAQGEPQAIGEQGLNAPKQASAPIPSLAGGAGNSPPTAVGQATKTASGLEYVTLKEGEGETAKAGQTIIIHYTGTLTDGTKFDSSRDRNKPFQASIGTGGLIKGWDEGIPGMKVGERRKLTIPPELGYGPGGTQGIPGNSTLLFDVELLGVK